MWGLTPIFRPKERLMKCSFMFCLIKCHPSPSQWPEIPGMPFPVLQDAQNELMDSGSQADIQAHFWSHAQRLGEHVDTKDEYPKLGLCRVHTCAYYIYIYTYSIIWYIILYIYGMFEIHEDTIHRERERCNLLIIFMIFMYPTLFVYWLCVYMCLWVFFVVVICNYLWTHLSPSRSQHVVFAEHLGLAMHVDEDLDPAQSALPAPNATASYPRR